MADPGGLDEAVERYIKLNADFATARAERTQAFDHLFKILLCDEPPNQPVQLEYSENSDNKTLSPHLLNLPPELHLKVVSYLDWHNTIALRLVSRYWRDIITPHGFNWRTSLLINKLRCQELNRCLELRLSELILPPGSPWISHPYPKGMRQFWAWAARYPCYTCMQWLHNHHFVPTGHLTAKNYRRRHVFLSNRWPVPKPPGSHWYRHHGFPAPAIRIPYDTEYKTPNRAGPYTLLSPDLEKTRMCIQCAAKKNFLPTGHLPGLRDYLFSQWIVCICKNVFWRADKTVQRYPEYDDLDQRGPNPPTKESPWRSFWWCQKCNEAGLSKQNWLLWAHELGIGASEARLERLEGHKIAQGHPESRKRSCPIVKEERNCYCARWFVQDVWDELAWKGNEKVQGCWGEYERERGISWLKYECRKALSERRVRLRPGRGTASTSPSAALAIRGSRTHP